jgi:hypothetical protein
MGNPKRDIELLKLIQTYFEGPALPLRRRGRIGKERNSCCDYTVGSLDQIATKVIPHFDKYPLKTKKHSLRRADYLLFKEAVMIMLVGNI